MVGQHFSLTEQRLKVLAKTLSRYIPEVWLAYAAAEISLGNAAEASIIYTRAVKLLDDPEPFISEFRLQQVARGGPP
jgi:hypothetical protein